MVWIKIIINSRIVFVIQITIHTFVVLRSWHIRLQGFYYSSDPEEVLKAKSY